MRKMVEAIMEPIKASLGKLGEEKEKAEVAKSTAEKSKELPKEMQTKMQEIHIRSLNFKSPGARSQYRLLAAFRMKMEASVAQLDDVMLHFSAPEEALYKALDPVKSLISGMATDAVNRIALVQQADQDPLGYKALNLWEEGELLEKGGDDVVRKFKECLKTAREAEKKKNAGKKPFQKGPGWNPGNPANTSNAQGRGDRDSDT